MRKFAIFPILAILAIFTNPAFSTDAPKAPTTYKNQKSPDAFWIAQAEEGLRIDIGNSTIPHIVTSPDGAIAYTIHILDDNHMPVEGALILLSFSPEVDSTLCWCENQPHPTITALTDSLGNAVFHIAGGGCANPADYTDPPVKVFYSPPADTTWGVLIATRGIVSYAIGGGSLGLCRADLDDAMWLGSIQGDSTYHFCGDLDQDGQNGLSDLQLITPYVSYGTNCTEGN